MLRLLILCAINFQLTTSRRGRQIGSYLFIEKVVFQLTTSRRGRRWASSHTKVIGLFQLTTSRRGRLQPGGLDTPVETFNSRPHAEVDMGKPAVFARGITFQLTTSRRGRLSSVMGTPTMAVFQLTTSRRGRLYNHLSLIHI